MKTNQVFNYNGNNITFQIGNVRRNGFGNRNGKSFS